MESPESDKHFSPYTLQDLVEDYNHTAVKIHKSSRDVVSSLDLHTPPSQDKVTIIGINGPTCAGKTSFTDQLVDSLESQNIPVVRISFDWFLHDRTKRSTLVQHITQNYKTIPEVTRTAWDIPRYNEFLHELKSTGVPRDNIVLTGLYDRTQGSQTANATIRVPYGGYAVVEGVGILDANSTELVDIHIRMDVNDDEILINRAIARENSKPLPHRLSEEFLRHRFKVMDLNHMRYLRKISREHNQLIVDVSDFNNIKTYRR